MRRGRKLVATLIVLPAACSGDDASADRKICEAILSVDARASNQDAADAVRAIKEAGSPASATLADVQSHAESVGNQMTLFARFDELEATCDAEGISLDLPTEQP